MSFRGIFECDNCGWEAPVGWHGHVEPPAGWNLHWTGHWTLWCDKCTKDPEREPVFKRTPYGFTVPFMGERVVSLPHRCPQCLHNLMEEGEDCLRCLSRPPVTMTNSEDYEPVVVWVKKGSHPRGYRTSETKLTAYRRVKDPSPQSSPQTRRNRQTATSTGR